MTTIPTIDVVIPEFGTRNDTEEVFVEKTNAGLSALNPWAQQANAFATAVNTELGPGLPAAIAAANYRGDYDAGTTYLVGQSVSFGGVVWQAKTENAGIEPAEGANWLRIDVSLPGDVRWTGQDLSGTGWLKCDGSVYLQSAHPNLFAEIGQGPMEYVKNIPEPSSVLPQPRGFAWSGDSSYFGVCFRSEPFFRVWSRAGATFTALADPVSLPTGEANNISLSSDGTFVAVAHNVTPFITIYERSGAALNKLTNPAVLPAGNAEDCAISPNNEFLAVAHATSPYVTIYQSSGSTWTKIANPGTLPTADANGVAWSADSQFLVVAHFTSPFITIYQRSGTTFTKLANPAALPTGAAKSAAFSADGTLLAIGHDTSPYLTVYEIAGTTFTKIADPATLPPENAVSVAISPESNEIAWAGFDGVMMFTWDGTTLAKAPDLDPDPASVSGLAWAPDGAYIGITSNTSTAGLRVQIYEPICDKNTEFTVPSLTSVFGDFDLRVHAWIRGS